MTSAFSEVLSTDIKTHKKKLSRVAEEAEKTDLQINTNKTDIIRVNNKREDPVRLHQENIREVEKFVYLGNVVIKNGGTEEDIKCRIDNIAFLY
jgi:hypothetical protein